MAVATSRSRVASRFPPAWLTPACAATRGSPGARGRGAAGITGARHVVVRPASPRGEHGQDGGPATGPRGG
ncbi:hypothetical protein, partial [Streptomyces sp. NPDC004685]